MTYQKNSTAIRISCVKLHKYIFAIYNITNKKNITKYILSYSEKADYMKNLNVSKWTQIKHVTCTGRGKTPKHTKKRYKITENFHGLINAKARPLGVKKNYPPKKDINSDGKQRGEISGLTSRANKTRPRNFPEPLPVGKKGCGKSENTP